VAFLTGVLLAAGFGTVFSATLATVPSTDLEIALAAFSSVAIAATLTLWATGLAFATAFLTTFCAVLAPLTVLFFTSSTFLPIGSFDEVASSILFSTTVFTSLNFFDNFLATNLLAISISLPILSASCPRCFTASRNFSLKLFSNSFLTAFFESFFLHL